MRGHVDVERMRRLVVYTWTEEEDTEVQCKDVLQDNWKERITRMEEDAKEAIVQFSEQDTCATASVLAENHVGRSRGSM